jgi:hypothetical protein
VTVDDAAVALVRNGRSLPAWEGDGPWAVCDTAGDLVAMYERVDARTAKPAVVLPATPAD